MKKRCDGCRAYVSGCLLGYKTKTTNKIIIGYTIKIQSPIEQCPKPKTNKDLINAINYTKCKEKT